MWSTVIRNMSFTGSVQAVKDGSLEPLVGVAVDVYRFHVDEFGEYQFERLNQLPTITAALGHFAFNDLPVSVKVRTVISGLPPYDSVELTHLESQPNLAFCISAEAALLGTGSQYVEVYDERTTLDAAWETAHPERSHVPLTGSPPMEIRVPQFIPVAVVPDKEFHFLRIGRATRDEIGELTDPKPGYMNSATPSFFPDIVDAPFGRTLQIGGQFGAGYTAVPTGSLYYSVSFEYSGSSTKHPIADPLFNKKYVPPVSPSTKGKWEALNLGPFNGTITAVDNPPHDSGLIGTSVMVYRRPVRATGEYWPFWDLMIIWNSTAADNELVVLTLEAYERTGGSDSNPQLKKLAMTPSTNDHLPLRIDNRRPVPVLLPYDSTDPNERKFHTAYAKFLGSFSGTANEKIWFSLANPLQPVTGKQSTPMDICNEMAVTPGDTTDGNECILVRYSVEDGSGNPHQHLSHYSIRAAYTPKAIVGAPDSKHIVLKNAFGTFEPIGANYAPATGPTMVVNNFSSVVVPERADGWPPEPCGDLPPLPNPPCDPTYQCNQYALEVSLGCTVRTINGWSRIFGHHHVSRHIIIKKS